MPTPRVDFALVASGGSLYTFGGSTGGSVVPYVEVFDPSTNTWATKTSMPTARMKTAAAEIGGKIYVVGGFTLDPMYPERILYRNVTEVYSTATDSWSTAAPPPSSFPVNSVEGNQLLSGAALDGILYVTVHDSNSPRLLKYDPQTDVWTHFFWSGLPGPLTSAVNNGRLFVLGGQGGGLTGGVLMEYDPSSSIWKTHPRLQPVCGAPCSYVSATLVAYRGELYGLGGFVSEYQVLPRLTDQVSRFDLARGEWLLVSTLPRRGYSFAASEVGGKLYVLGGSSWIPARVPIGLVFELEPN